MPVTASCQYLQWFGCFVVFLFGFFFWWFRFVCFTFFLNHELSSFYYDKLLYSGSSRVLLYSKAACNILALALLTLMSKCRVISSEKQLALQRGLLFFSLKGV